MLERSRIAGMVLVGALAAGCGPIRVRAGTAPSDPGQGTAIVSGRVLPLAGHYVTIQKVDGAVIERGMFQTQEVEMSAPGEHTFELSYVAGYTHSTSNALVRVLTEPGHRYRIHAESVREGFWSEMGKGVVGGKGHWVAWVEDEASGAVVAGRRPHGTFTTTFEDASDATER